MELCVMSNVGPEMPIHLVQHLTGSSHSCQCWNVGWTISFTVKIAIILSRYVCSEAILHTHSSCLSVSEVVVFLRPLQHIFIIYN